MAKINELTSGLGAHSVMEALGIQESTIQWTNVAPSRIHGLDVAHDDAHFDELSKLEE